MIAWLLCKTEDKKRNTCVPIKSKKNRQIITFQAAKIQHKPRCVTLKNGENLNKICISALPLTPPYTQWCQNYFEVAFHFFLTLALSICRSKTILDKFKLCGTCPKNIWTGPNFVFGPIKGQPNGFKRRWNSFQCVIDRGKNSWNCGCINFLKKLHATSDRFLPHCAPSSIYYFHYDLLLLWPNLVLNVYNVRFSTKI